MGKETDSIRIISTAVAKTAGNVNYETETWDIQREKPRSDLCFEYLKADNVGSKKQCQSVRAIYNKHKNGSKEAKDQIPANLTFYGIQRSNGLFQSTAIHYFANINGEEIYLQDDSVISETPDGRITPGELLSIGGFTYTLHEVRVEGDPSVYIEFIDEEARGTKNPAPYDGFRFFRKREENNRWVFSYSCRPLSVKNAQNQIIKMTECAPVDELLKVEGLLNGIEEQYSLDLAEAAEAIGKPIQKK